MGYYSGKLIGLQYNGNEIEVDNYISGLSTPLSSTQIGKLNTFVKSIKVGMGITLLSDYFDIMYILAGETNESSLKNIVKNAHHATNPGNLPFTQFEGFQGPNNIINTNYNIYSQSVNVLQNSLSAGFYSRTGGSGVGTVEMGCVESNPFFVFQVAYNGTKTYIELNNAIGTGFSNNTRLGFYSASRTTSSNYKVYKNGSVLGTENIVSNSLPNSNIFLLGFQNKSFSNIQISFAFAGRGLTDSEMTILKNSIESYMDSNNKGVI